MSVRARRVAGSNRGTASRSPDSAPGPRWPARPRSPAALRRSASVNGACQCPPGPFLSAGAVDRAAVSAARVERLVQGEPDVDQREVGEGLRSCRSARRSARSPRSPLWADAQAQQADVEPVAAGPARLGCGCGARSEALRKDIGMADRDTVADLVTCATLHCGPTPPATPKRSGVLRPLRSTSRTPTARPERTSSGPR